MRKSGLLIVIKWGELFSLANFSLQRMGLPKVIKKMPSAGKL